jgi:endothelin-converting enzyme/putative endopeptidase
VNFGAIGEVIGHELTHGFDDQGRKYNAKGNLSDWWTPADAREFEKRADCFVHQYSGTMQPLARK